ncbi:MAG: hypothetical protein FH749_07665 [Firmicutes bacterium]|nr:hypothetical protein [Bacillota bacterium]
MASNAIINPDIFLPLLGRKMPGGTLCDPGGCSMDQFIDVQKAIAPELQTVIQRRYMVLRAIAQLAPVGRRTLADVLKIGERVIRTEVDVLKVLGLVEAGIGGVVLSKRGEDVFLALTPYVKEVLGLPRLEELVGDALGIERVIIVPGDSNRDPLVRRELGRAAARLLQKELKNDDVVAITGGTTMAYVAEMARTSRQKVTVVPGRGALGERVEIQANTIAAQLAQALGGKYKLLHAPDNLSPQAMEELARDQRIAEVLELIRNASVLIHGIGDAQEMARRRDTRREQLARLEDLGAVAEAFGYYFNAQGEIVWQVNSIGLRLSDLVGINMIIAVAGGADKARAIRAVAAHHRQHILITDQGAADALLNLSR